MKKLWRFIKWSFLSIVSLVLILIIVLAISGIPNLGSAQSKNVPRVGWSNLLTTMDALSSISMLVPVGFDESNNYNYGMMTFSGLQLKKIDNATNEVIGTDISFPFGQQFQKFPGSDTKYTYLSDPVGDEQYQLYLYDSDTDSTTVLFEETYAVYTYKVSPDGSLLLVFDFDMETYAHTLYRVDLDEDSDPVALCSFEHSAVLIETFDTSLEHAFIILTSDDKTGRLLRVNLETGEYDFVFEEEKTNKFWHGSFPTWYIFQNRFVLSQNDSTSFYARTGTEDNEAEFVALWEKNIYTGESRKISPDIDADVWHIDISDDERYLVYMMVEKSLPKLFAYDRTTRTNIELYNDEVYRIIYYTPQFHIHAEKSLVYFTAASLKGKQLMQVDIETGEIRVLDKTFDETTPEPSYEFSEIETPVFDSIVGVTTHIQTFMYTPKQSEVQRHPVFINFHGGPDLAIEYYMLDPFESVLLQKDFVVLKPNYRGTWSFGNSFEQADDGYKRQDQVRDVGNLIEWIKQQPYLDADKIVAYGVSWGGYMTVESMIMYPDAFVCGVSMLGVLDLKTLAEDRFLRGWTPGEVGWLDRDSSLGPFLDSISPCYNADQITKPLCLLQGGKDPRVKPIHGQRTMESLDAAGKEYWYIEFPNAGHTMLGSPPDMIYMSQSVLEFIDRAVE